MEIYAFSDINDALVTKIPTIQSEIVFCGGIKYWKNKNYDSFSFLKRLKEERREKFTILFSPGDILLMKAVLDLVCFIRYSKKYIKNNYVKEIIPKPKNILNFRSEYENFISKQKIKEILDNRPVEFSGRELSFLNTIITLLSENNPFDFSVVRYLLLNSSIVYETEHYVFIPEHGRLNYTDFYEINEKYKRGIDALVSFQKDNFISWYMEKHKKITLPFIDKKYIVGNSKKTCDFPYYRDNAIYINSSVKYSTYLENGIIQNYTNESYCIVKISDKVEYECLNCKGEIINDTIREDYESIINFEIVQDESTKDIATRVSEEYYIIETKNAFIVCKRNEFEVKEVNILELADINKKNLEKYKNFIRSEHKNIQELSRKFTSILKKDTDEKSEKSDRSGRRVSFSEIFDVILDSSDEDH